MKIKKGDQIVVIAGKEKGKTGTVTKVFPQSQQVIVENINLRTKFVKKGNGKPGEQAKIEARLSASNVMLIDTKTKKRTRIGYKLLENGKKVRLSKVSNEVIE
jgi:large subunit ribosomal protein L24